MKQLKVTHEHDAIVQLLPWYVNDTLDEFEMDLVRTHIDSCEECHDNIELLSRVQQVVRIDSPAPLVPAPRVKELLQAIDSPEHDRSSGRRWPLLAAAASIILVVAVTALLLVQPDTDSASPTQFQTATSAASSDSIDYVIELQFSPETDASGREAFFRTIEIREPVVSMNNFTYRVTVGLGAVSLSDLEHYIDGIEANPAIATAEVVAVQLPVE
ncbi:MAG: zf-HC2 domain-containing protein [Woeseiaceae bacterium]|nr:zf-HC2 domain-containing protein [Woeseiaceae bacterium]